MCAYNGMHCHGGDRLTAAAAAAVAVSAALDAAMAIMTRTNGMDIHSREYAE